MGRIAAQIKAKRYLHTWQVRLSLLLLIFPSIAIVGSHCDALFGHLAKK